MTTFQHAPRRDSQVGDLRDQVNAQANAHV
jgi:hypothetical protein